ncbi:MAG: DUF1571 domain-containing protein [Planctomycetes bacterium]|nr:DUF1571 domain-containing protein [Planctomycetota bacterium]
MFALSRRSLIWIVLLAGCTSPGKKNPPPQPPPITRGTPASPKPLAIPERTISPARQRDELDDKARLIPQAPRLEELTQRALDVKPPEDASPLQVVKNDEPIKTAMTDDSLVEIKNIHQRAVAAYSKVDSFEARLTRRETIKNKATPQEVIFFQFRKEPYSVHLKWIGTEGKGREVLYVQGQHNGKMHVKPSKEDASPLPPMRMSFNPDDSMVRSKSRHDIRQAGLGDAIRQLGNILDMIARDPSQRYRLKYLGQVTRPESVNKMDTVEETILPKTEALLPQGGRRIYFFETGTELRSRGLPTLVIAYDAANKEVEYYCFDNFMLDIKLNDADFDPDLVLKKK